jgi:anti-sigma factor RsiW
MEELNDERLIAYLDGELDAAERNEVAAWLDREPAAAARASALVESARRLRSALGEAAREPVPERLIAAVRGVPAQGMGLRIVPFARRPRDARAAPQRLWRVLVPAAAALFGIIVGGGGAYFGAGMTARGGSAPQPALEAAANNLWLDTAAGYFKLFVSAGDNALVDVPATGDVRAALQKISQSLPQAVRLPDLKPWGLTFRGARLVVVEGRPAAQLVYTTDNKAIGPLALIIGSSKQADISPTFDRRQDVNVLYWRHQGRAYALVGQADIGYLWGIGNDVAWQLDAI